MSEERNYQEAANETAAVEESTVEETAAAEAVQAEEAATPEPKRRGGRKPMTAEQKAESAQRRAQQKKLADNLRPVVYIQFRDVDMNIDELIEQAKAEFRKEKKRTRITDMRLYVKPEERTAYYVINNKTEGKVDF